MPVLMSAGRCSTTLFGKFAATHTERKRYLLHAIHFSSSSHFTTGQISLNSQQKNLSRAHAMTLMLKTLSETLTNTANRLRRPVPCWHVKPTACWEPTDVDCDQRSLYGSECDCTLNNNLSLIAVFWYLSPASTTEATWWQYPLIWPSLTITSWSHDQRCMWETLWWPLASS